MVQRRALVLVSTIAALVFAVWIDCRAKAREPRACERASG